jgi:cytochrome c oxidase subunit IV
MTDRRNTSALWKGPAAAWLVLLALFAVSLGSAYVPLGAGNVTVNLLVAAIMIGVLVTVLMDLRRANSLTRIVAAAGLFWIALMFALTFTDYLSRHY